MASAKKLVADDPEIAAFRIRNDRAIQVLHPRRDNTRRRELHVSDFTKGDKEFCARQVLARWWRGDSSEFTSAIQRDGKFREQKWHEQFDAAGIVFSYQPEFRLGLLVGHPDWVLDWGFGPRIIDLTGQDRRLDFIQLARHTAMKKRQVRLYLVMSDLKRGFVILEDKASCDFRMITVEREQKEEEALVWRVATVTQAVQSLSDSPSDMEIVKAMRVMPRCRKATCHWCQSNQDHKLLEAAEATLETLAEVAPDEHGSAEIGALAGEAAQSTGRTAEQLLELLALSEEGQTSSGSSEKS